jgi:puromycin-sensitive aminopeptidase
VRDLLRPAIHRLGLEPVDGESDRDRELRGVLVRALGVLGNDEHAQGLARQLYTASVETPGSVDPSLTAAAVSVLAAVGGSADFDEFVARSRQAPTPQEELRFLSALADFASAELMDRVLAMVLTDAVRTQNAPYLLRRCLVNRDHGARAWQFVVDHWDEINERFPSNSIVRLLEGVRALSKPEVADEVFGFFESHEVPQGDKTLAQHLEGLEVAVALRRREGPRLADHFS